MSEPEDTDTVWQRDEVESPCVKLCALHPVEGICVGCYRTGEEIARWSAMSPQARRALIAQLPARAERLKRRRGGRRARHDG